jgi:hypothetical protein
LSVGGLNSWKNPGDGNACIRGNLGVGVFDTAKNKLAIQKQLGSDDVSAFQHDLQLEVRSGLGPFQSRSVALGLLDNGKGVLQVKESNVGYNDLLLNPVSGNVGVGTATAQQKLHVQGGADTALVIGDRGTSGNLGLQFLGSGHRHAGLRFDGDNLIVEEADSSFAPSNWWSGGPLNFYVRNGNACIGGAWANARLTVDTGGGPANSLWCEHHGSNFVVRPLSAGGNSTAIENTGGGGLFLNPGGASVQTGGDLRVPTRIVIGDWIIENRQEQAFGQNVSAIYFSHGGRDIARFGDVRDMMQIHKPGGGYFYCNQDGNTGWN